VARARNLKPGFFRNADLVELPYEARLMFAGLWTIADREGRMEDRPKQIKMEIFPADTIDCDALLNMLQSAGMIERYSVENKNYIQVVNFSKHQNPHRDEKPSVIPCKHSASTVQAQCNEDAGTMGIGLNPYSLIPSSLNPSSLTPETGLPSKDLPAPSAQAAKKATRLPADWQLPKAWGEWALSEKPVLTVEDVRLMADMFRDHWLANASRATGKKDDWFATWRNWVRRSDAPKGNKQSVASNDQTREAARARLFGGQENATA